jgi:murein DD-endopeptidase MepM/ murein hydrolase activator NlpD
MKTLKINIIIFLFVTTINVIHAQNSEFQVSEIPSIWPIKDGLGHISKFFGQNISKYTGEIFFHRGIDISTYRSGDPIVATANGQVVTVGYNTELGNNIIIKHKNEYYTLYRHMLSFRVRIGQMVEQGEIIGYIGNTGLSTEAHLHYEIHIGSDAVDPIKYINVNR